MPQHDDVTIAQAAKAAGISTQRIYKLIDEGRLPVRRVRVERMEYRVPHASLVELQERAAARLGSKAAVAA